MKSPSIPPKISVIVTCYNLEEYLDECMDSIKQQVYQAHEVILVHDGCKEKAKAYNGVTTIFCSKNNGVARSRDMGFKISTGDHIVFFDGDDVMPYNYLLELQKQDYDVVYPNCIIWTGWGNSGGQNVFHEAPASVKIKQLLVKNEILMPAMFKRKWYDEVEGFDPTLELFEDYDFWLRIMNKGAVFKKSSAFMYYRQRTLSRNHKKDELKREVYRKIIEKFTLNSKKDSKV